MIIISLKKYFGNFLMHINNILVPNKKDKILLANLHGKIQL